jgi:subtilisin family serine protease
MAIAMMMFLGSSDGNAFFLPNDPHWNHPTEDQWGPENIDVDDAWDLSNAQTEGGGFTNPGSRDIVVAVLDTGIDPIHQDLEDNIWGAMSWDYTDDDSNVKPNNNEYTRHGTHVAGIIAAITDNNIGISGIAQVRLIIKKLYNDDGTFVGGDPAPDPQNWADAVNDAVTQGADIIQISSGPFTNDGGEWDNFYDALGNAIDNNIIVVMSAGNYNWGRWDKFDLYPLEHTDCKWEWIDADTDGDRELPEEAVYHENGFTNMEGHVVYMWFRVSEGDDIDDAMDMDFSECDHPSPLNDQGYSREHILFVGATDINNLRDHYSYYGDSLDVMAPGGDRYAGKIYSTVLENGYEFESGTSMAAPHVSGIAALILSYKPYLSMEEVENIIKETSDDIVDSSGHGDNPPGNTENPVPGWDHETGYGIVNCEKALRLANEWKHDWSPKEQQSGVYIDPTYTDGMEMTSDRCGFTHIVFIDDRHGFRQVYYRRITPAGTLQINDLRITDNTVHCDHPKVQVDSLRCVHISWVETTNEGYESIEYVKYNPDMSGILIAQTTVDETMDDLNYGTIKLVYAWSQAVGGSAAYIFFDFYTDDMWDILYRTVDNNGNVGDQKTFYSGPNSDGYGPYGFDVGLSVLSATTWIHVVWQTNSGSENLNDIWYQSMDTSSPTSRIPVVPLAIADSARDEKYPSMDVQYEDGIAHIVYESWVNQDSRANQLIEYSVIDHEGNFILQNAQVGTSFDQNDETGLDGKWYPQVAYSYNDIVTIAWRQWDEANGYMSVFYKQFFLELEQFYDTEIPPYGLAISPVFMEAEKVLVADICSISRVHHDAIVLEAADRRVPQTLTTYDLDSHFQLLFLEELGIWNYRFDLITTREYWAGIQNIGFMDCKVKEPDIAIDGNGFWHIVYASTRPPAHNNWEIYYRNGYNVNEKLVSFPLDGFNSITPKIVTMNYLDTVIAYIVWIDFKNNQFGELWYSAVNAMTFMTIINPVRVPFVMNPPLRKEDQHEIALDSLGIIHVIFRTVQGATSQIHHGSFNFFGVKFTEDCRINRVDPQMQYKNPAIDIGPYNRPYVVYVEYKTGHSDILYDALEFKGIGGGRYIYDIWMPVELNIEGMADNPDIKFDHFSPRNCQVAPENPNPFVHIVWAENWAGWRVVYGKYHPLDVSQDPEINERVLEPSEGYFTGGMVDPELAITSENDIALMYTAKTMGYAPNPGNANYYRVFFVLLDNNGIIRTTNTYISDNSNYDIINSASAINNDNRLFVAWDCSANGNFLNTIMWRTYD